MKKEKTKQFTYYLELKCVHCRSEIRLYILWSLIFTYTVHTYCIVNSKERVNSEKEITGTSLAHANFTK